MRNSTLLTLGIWASGFSGCDRDLKVEEDPIYGEAAGKGNTNVAAGGSHTTGSSVSVGSTAGDSAAGGTSSAGNSGATNGGAANGGAANGGAANGGAANGGATNGGATQDGLAGDGSLLGSGGSSSPSLQGGAAGMTGKLCRYRSDCSQGETCFSKSPDSTVGLCVAYSTEASCQAPPDVASLCTCVEPFSPCPSGMVCGISTGITWGYQLGCYSPSSAIPANTHLRCRTHADCSIPIGVCYVPGVVDNCEDGPLGYCVTGATPHSGLNMPFNPCGSSILGPLQMPEFPEKYRSGGDTRCASCSAPSTGETTP